MWHVVVLFNVVLQPGSHCNSGLVAGMPPREPRYDFEPYDGTPGEAWEFFDERLQNHLAGETDDRGWSLADYLLGVDEGGAAGPTFPQGHAGAIERRKGLQARRRREKDTYAIIARHVTDPDWTTDLRTHYF